MTRVEAFFFLTKCLAPEDNTAELAAQIEANLISWERVVRLAGEHWLTPALYSELRRKRLHPLLPEDLIEYFEFIYNSNRERNENIRAHIAQIVRLLNRIGVEPLLLKGPSHLISGLYHDPATRMMSDIDIQVPADRAHDCWRRLLADGYRPTGPKARTLGDRMPEGEWPALIHPDRAAELEMHRPGERDDLMSDPSMALNSEPVDVEGARAQLLNPTNRIALALSHSWDRHQAQLKADIPLRDLCDAALIQHRHAPEIDWQAHARRPQIRAACAQLRRVFPPGPPLTVRPPALAGLFWQRCLLKLEHPFAGLIADRCLLMFSRSPDGHDARRSLLNPGLQFRKLRKLRAQAR